MAGPTSLSVKWSANLNRDIVARRKADIKVFGRLREVVVGQTGQREGEE